MAVKKEKGNTTLSDAEKEKLIIKLLSENKSWNKITQLLHVSPNTISNVNKKNKGIKNQPPVDIQALKMFEDGKQPVDVCIALQINFEEARQYCHEYRLLRGEEDLPKVSDILGRDLVTFVDLFRKMMSVFSLELIKDAFRIAEKKEDAIATLTIIEWDKEREQKALEKLKQERIEILKNISVAKDQLNDLLSLKQNLRVDVESRAEEIDRPQRHLSPIPLSKLEEIVKKSLVNYKKLN